MKRKRVFGFARAAVAAVVFVVATGCSGCLWLAIPSLAYQGYKAEEPSKSQPVKSKSPGDAQSTKKADAQFE